MKELTEAQQVVRLGTFVVAENIEPKEPFPGDATMPGYKLLTQEALGERVFAELVPWDESKGDRGEYLPWLVWLESQGRAKGVRTRTRNSETTDNGGAWRQAKELVFAAYKAKEEKAKPKAKANMEFINYETDGRVAVITLDRPEKSNAQHAPMLRELDSAWDTAAADDDIRVIVVRANGKHFSAGHDLSDEGKHWWSQEVDIESKGLEAVYQWERTHYLGFTRKWRDIPKPSIAAVQGACIAGGLMLAWPCDLIIAADDAKFSDPVARMAIGGVEYHGHTWELGARKAKELLFTGRYLGAEEAEKLGMVNRVVPRDSLDSETMQLANEIAEMHPFGLAAAKRAVNQTLDIMGFYASLQSVFDIHATGHGNALSVTGGKATILSNLEEMKSGAKHV